jgi:hypothetical protein
VLVVPPSYSVSVAKGNPAVRSALREVSGGPFTVPAIAWRTPADIWLTHINAA